MCKICRVAKHNQYLNRHSTLHTLSNQAYLVLSEAQIWVILTEPHLKVLYIINHLEVSYVVPCLKYFVICGPTC